MEDEKLKKYVDKNGIMYLRTREFYLDNEKFFEYINTEKRRIKICQIINNDIIEVKDKEKLNNIIEKNFIKFNECIE